jgi:hypothetical protein
MEDIVKALQTWATKNMIENTNEGMEVRNNKNNPRIMMS